MSGEPGNPDADVLLRVKNDRLWVVRPDRPWVTTPGAYDETPSIDLKLYPESLAGSLKNAVWSLARAAKLIRVTSALNSAGESEDGIGISAVMARPPAHDAKAACKTDAAPETAQASPVSPMLPAAAGNCDYVQIDVTNDSSRRSTYFITIRVSEAGTSESLGTTVGPLDADGTDRIRLRSEVTSDFDDPRCEVEFVERVATD